MKKLISAVILMAITWNALAQKTILRNPDLLIYV